MSRMDLINRVHKQGHVEKIEYLANTIRIKAGVPQHLAGLLEQAAAPKK